jgi:hypothetical protein
MGSSIEAYIEYDRTLWDKPNATDIAPFSRVPEAIDLTGFTLFRSGKDYHFFAAISGIRNQTDTQHLYPLRGLPSPCSAEAERGLEQLYGPDDLSWLTLGEIEEALAHMGWGAEDLSLETNTVLATMAYLEGQLGKDRVRLVFGIA